jgi:hypothetical protein
MILGFAGKGPRAGRSGETSPATGACSNETLPCSPGCSRCAFTLSGRKPLVTRPGPFIPWTDGGLGRPAARRPTLARGRGDQASGRGIAAPVRRRPGRGGGSGRGELATAGRISQPHQLCQGHARQSAEVRQPCRHALTGTRRVAPDFASTTAGRGGGNRSGRAVRTAACHLSCAAGILARLRYLATRERVVLGVPPPPDHRAHPDSAHAERRDRPRRAIRALWRAGHPDPGGQRLDQAQPTSAKPAAVCITNAHLQLRSVRQPVTGERRIDAPKLVKAFRAMFVQLVRDGRQGWASGVCWVADKTGLGHEGRLLIGHAQQVKRGFRGRPTDRSKASTRGCGSRLAGQAAPGSGASRAGGGRPRGQRSA